MRLIVLAAVLAAQRFVIAQNEKADAVARACEFIQGSRDNERYSELISLALLAAGKQDPLVVEKLPTLPHIGTHRSALRAVIYHFVDGAKNKNQIAVAAQYLLNQQNEEGGWSFGTYMPEVKLDEKEPFQLSKASRTKAFPKGCATHLATLALWCAAQNDIKLPPEPVADALKWWKKTQTQSGGWACCDPFKEGRAYPSSIVMAGCSLILCGKLTKEDVSQMTEYVDNHLTHNFELTPERWRFYYYFSLEMYAALTKKFDDLLAKVDESLVKSQQINGSWNDSVEDTCFAILAMTRFSKKLFK